MSARPETPNVQPSTELLKLDTQLAALKQEDLPSLKSMIEKATLDLEATEKSATKAQEERPADDDLQAFQQLSTNLSWPRRIERQQVILSRLQDRFSTLTREAEERREGMAENERALQELTKTAESNARLVRFVSELQKQRAAQIKDRRELQPAARDLEPQPEKDLSKEQLTTHMLEDVQFAQRMMEMGLVDLDALNDSLTACQALLSGKGELFQELGKLFISDVLVFQVPSKKEGGKPSTIRRQMNQRINRFQSMLGNDILGPDRRPRTEGLSEAKNVENLALALRHNNVDLSILEPLILSAREKKLAEPNATQALVATDFLHQDAPNRETWINLLQGEPQSPEEQALQNAVENFINTLQYRSGRRLEENRPPAALVAAHLRFGMEQYSPFINPEATQIALERFGAVLRSRLEAFFQIHRQLTETETPTARQLGAESEWLKNNGEAFFQTLQKMCTLAEETPGMVMRHGEQHSAVRDIVFGRFIFEAQDTKEKAKRISAFAALFHTYENILEKKNRNRKDTV